MRKFRRERERLMHDHSRFDRFWWVSALASNYAPSVSSSSDAGEDDGESDEEVATEHETVFVAAILQDQNKIDCGKTLRKPDGSDERTKRSA